MVDRFIRERQYLSSQTDQRLLTMESSISPPSSSGSTSGRSGRATLPDSPTTVGAEVAVVAGASPSSSRLDSDSPLVDLVDLAPASMDMNSFQSANDRRNKLVGEKANPTQNQPLQQQQQQPQHQHLQPRLLQPQHVTMALHTSTQPQHQPQAQHTRSLSSANWRTQRMEDIPILVAQPHNIYGVYEQYSPHYQTNRPAGHLNLRTDQPHYFQHLGAPLPLPIPIPEGQSDGSFYAYCYDRGNGRYTRLIPADMLPPLVDIPAVQQGSTGMVILPHPRGLPPNGHSSNTERVAIRGNTVHPNSPSDTIQSRIDNIIAATPSTPTQAGTSGIGAPTSSAGGAPSQRRPKIYCDKWVHEGTCAFTQQGCKYKHEMPSDKATQHQLGLFHGYPQWWKKHQADLARQREMPMESPGSDAGGSNPDSRSNTERYVGRVGPSSGGGQGPARDTGRWRNSGEYAADSRALGPPAPMLRSTLMTPNPLGIPSTKSLTVLTSNHVSSTSGFSGPHNTSMQAPDSDLTSCPASYGSPFGPIAPPARNSAAFTGLGLLDATRGSPRMHHTTKSQNMSQSLHGGNPTDGKVSASSKLPTKNPYATLDTIDSTEEHGTAEGHSAGSQRPSGAHLP
ncbi:hypothetical protein F5Y17DRAFT_73131 [Xylariaceae sp. FL0594]|nr:hypothetical protein F5Y17DRAFT_73131 [Xylariaceae sp. FL0594]